MDDFDEEGFFVVPDAMEIFYKLGCCQGGQSICECVIKCIESGIEKEIEPEIMLDTISQVLKTNSRIYRKGIKQLREQLINDD